MEQPYVYPIIIPTTSELTSYNFYLLKDQNRLSLIDAGINTDESWSLFKQTLHKNGFSINDLDQIILTHHHNDHIGLVNRITQQIDIPVYAHRKSFSRLRRDPQGLQNRIDFFQELYTIMGDEHLGNIRVSKMKESLNKNKDNVIHSEITPIKEGDFFGSFKVIETPGHSSDHIALYDENSESLLVGDHLLAHISTNALVEPTKTGAIFPSLLLYEQSLIKCKQLTITTAYPGHGRIIDNPQQLIEQRIKSITRKMERIIKIMNSKQITAAEIAKTYYGRRYESLFPLVMSEIIGQLIRMESLDYVDYETRNNIRYYYLT